MYFISTKNTVEFDSHDPKNNQIAVYIDEQYVVYNYQGSISFFQDEDGAGYRFVDYRQSLSLNIVPELSDPNLVLLNYNEDHVIEWIMECEYELLRKSLEDY